MRKVFILLSVLCLAALVQADVLNVKEIQILQGTGARSQYDNPDLTWSGGSVAYIVTNEGDFAIFEKSDINAQFSLFSDDTLDGPAKARFDLADTWKVDLYALEADTTPVVTITGNMNGGGGFGGKYWEERSWEGQLNGEAWVNVISVDVDPDWLATVLAPGDTLIWDTDGIAGLDSDITLDDGTDISNYLGSYLSQNGLTVTLFSDQSQVVPEPATMLLLGLGALSLLRKRS